MNNLKEYLIPFVGLKIGKHQFDYQIDNTFFKNFDYDEFNDVSVKVDIVLEKKSTMLELEFKHKGTVNVPCDVSGEEFDLPIKGKLRLLVKFGDAFNDENEELLQEQWNQTHAELELLKAEDEQNYVEFKK